MGDVRLTDEQRRLVADHLGLVGMHLKRHVPGLSRPTRDREWDDLFQEGCIGLARAAASYDPAGGIPFPSFAQRRIQKAVRLALQGAFLTVRVPEIRPNRSTDPAGYPRVTGLDRTTESRRASRRHDPAAGVEEEVAVERGGETIGQAIRRRYDAAVGEAVRSVLNDPDACGADRGRLVERVAKERVSIPEEAYRVPLRRLAQSTGSSYARVRYAERRLTEVVRESLHRDAAMDVLRVAARRSEEGVGGPLSETDVKALDEAARRRFVEAFEAAAVKRQGVALMSAMRRSGLNPGRAAGSLFRRLGSADRQRLTELVAGVMDTGLRASGGESGWGDGGAGVGREAGGASSKQSHGARVSRVADPKP